MIVNFYQNVTDANQTVCLTSQEHDFADNVEDRKDCAGAFMLPGIYNIYNP